MHHRVAAGPRVQAHGRDAPQRRPDEKGTFDKFRHEDDLIGSLSGGNQQKVLLSRWLLLEPAIILMNEPTRGVDIGAKQEIYDLMFALTSRGFSFIITLSVIENCWC